MPNFTPSAQITPIVLVTKKKKANKAGWRMKREKKKEFIEFLFVCLFFSLLGMAISKNGLIVVLIMVTLCILETGNIFKLSSPVGSPCQGLFAWATTLLYLMLVVMLLHEEPKNVFSVILGVKGFSTDMNNTIKMSCFFSLHFLRNRSALENNTSLGRKGKVSENNSTEYWWEILSSGKH